LLCCCSYLAASTALCPSASSFDSAPLFFSHAPPPTQIYTLSLHDALPIYPAGRPSAYQPMDRPITMRPPESTSITPRSRSTDRIDRKSTRLNSSHQIISYAVFCLKKKKNTKNTSNRTRTNNINKIQTRPQR